MANPYEKAVANRREEDARRKVLQAEQDALAEAQRQAAEWEARAKEAVYKAEFAYEVLRAILDELRRGRPVSKPSLQTAWNRLESLPSDMRAILMASYTKLDEEMRKEEPYKRKD